MRAQVILALTLLSLFRGIMIEDSTLAILSGMLVPLAILNVFRDRIKELL